MHISAKVDYAVRAAVMLAASGDKSITGNLIAQSQDIPSKFLEGILTELRRSGLVLSHRGQEGGYRLARPAAKISIADIIRAIDGPLAEVRGNRPEAMSYEGPAESLQEVWIVVRASLRNVLEHTTINDVANGRLPANVRKLTADPDAWLPH